MYPLIQCSYHQNHCAVEMVLVSCTPKPLDVFNGFLCSWRWKKTKELEPLPSFGIGLTQMEEEGRNVTDGDKNKKQKTKEAKGKEKKQHIKMSKKKETREWRTIGGWAERRG